MRFSTAACMCLSALVLSGCQSLFAGRNNSQFAASIKPSGPMTQPDEQLAKGRQALDEGQFGSAITAFSSLRHDSDRAGDAFNGMAIAYANLGRPDLAERFFRQAIAVAPGDRRFHHNLARFYSNFPESGYRIAFGQQADPKASETLRPEGFNGESRVLAGNGQRPAIRIDVAGQSLVRVSAREVGIRTRPEPAPVARAKLSTNSQNLANGRRLNPNYPVRVQMAGDKFAEITDAYPARVSFHSPK